MGMDSALRLGRSLVGVGMAVAAHVSLSGIDLEHGALGLHVCLHLRSVVNGLRLRVLVAAGFQEEELRHSRALNLRRQKTWCGCVSQSIIDNVDMAPRCALPDITQAKIDLDRTLVVCG